MLSREFGENLVEVVLVVVVDETIVEDTKRLVTEETEDVAAIANCAHIRLEDACNPQHNIGEDCRKMEARERRLG